MKFHIVKKYFLALLLINMVLSYANIAYAQQSNVPVYSGVQDSIKQYLCTPTDAANSGTANPASSDLYTCINKLYRVAIAIGSVAGILFIVIAGYVYMSAEGSQESVDRAKNIFVSTITAMVILFGGYVFLRAINPDLISFRTTQPPSVVMDTSGWNQWRNDIGGVSKDQVGAPAQNGTCSEPVKNLCQAVSGTCPSNACGSYDTAIKSAAGKISISGVDTEALIRAIMYNESSCNITAQSGAGSCGLMQLQPSTANTLKAACGVSDNITCDWLKNPANATASICIGAMYLKNLASVCGNSVRNIAAGYNGGSMACQPSVTCGGQTDCSGDPVRKWECYYNGPQGSTATCNTGYTETRNYAPKVLGCYQQNGGR